MLPKLLGMWGTNLVGAMLVLSGSLDEEGMNKLSDTFYTLLNTHATCESIPSFRRRRIVAMRNRVPLNHARCFCDGPDRTPRRAHTRERYVTYRRRTDETALSSFQSDT